MPLPDFIIAGETKCGTTSMYNNLIQHPDILPTLGNGDSTITDDGEVLGVKELRFFDRYYNLGLDWYKDCFPKCSAGQITGEATPMYLYRTQAIQRMSEVVPDCKIIVLLRNPVDRLVSHYNHLRNVSGKLFYPSFKSFWTTAYESDYYLIDKGIYWQTIERLYGYYPREQVKVIISEELFSNPQEIWNETLDFLGVGPAPLKPKHSRKNTKTNQQIDTKLREEISEFYAPHNFVLCDLLEREISWASL